MRPMINLPAAYNLGIAMLRDRGQLLHQLKCIRPDLDCKNESNESLRYIIDCAAAGARTPLDDDYDPFWQIRQRCDSNHIIINHRPPPANN